jgi:hypothetical protein
MKRLAWALLAAAALAQAADAPYGAAVAARFPAPPVHYETPGLRDGRDTFTSNAELAALLAELAKKPGVRLVEAGRSQEGSALEALHFSRGAGRPAVLLLGQQHGDEPAGAEALLALAQQLAQPADKGPALLDRIDVVILPRVNPDGAASGSRVSRDGHDINRDHLLLRTPEARAVAALVRRFEPIAVADAHEHTVVGRYLQKFGALQRYDLLLQQATTANLESELTGAGETMFLAPLRARLDRERITHEWYYTNPTTPGDLQLSMGGVQPDTARNVQGLRHSVSVLLESRGVGIGRLHLQRRVHSHVLALTSLLESAAAHAGELQALRATLGARLSAAACRGPMTVLAAQTRQQRELTMIDPETGADKAVAVSWNSSLKLRPVIERPRPCGYWLAADAGEAAERLRELGIVVRRLAEPAELDAEGWRETARAEGARSDVRGRIADAERSVQVMVETERKKLEAPAGSFYVGLDQPLANLAVAALEPDTQNSFFANRLLPALASAARVMAPPAPSAPPPAASEQRSEHPADDLAPDRGADAAHR